MSLILQIILLLFCVGLLVTIIRQINRSRVLFSDFNYWIIFILCLIVLGAFPMMAENLATLIGIQNPVFGIFLFVIFLLILLVLSATFRISFLMRKFIQLSQKIALVESDLKWRMSEIEHLERKYAAQKQREEERKEEK